MNASYNPGAEPQRSTPLAVAFCTDDRFSVPLAAALHSLLDGCDGSPPPAVFIVGEITDPNKCRLRRVARGRANVDFISVDKAILSNLPVSENLSQAAYYRILLPNLLPTSLDKIIYLDVDIVINGNIYNLWNEDIRGFALAAARDTHVFSTRDSASTGAVDPTSSSCRPYFNSGVMLLNLDYWRRDDLTSRVIDYTRRNSASNLYCDQDGLNAVLGTRWKELDTRWNLQTATLLPSVPQATEKETYLRSVRSKLSTLTSQSHIVHFTQGRKPWHPFCPHPFRRQFHYYFLSSEFFETNIEYAWWYAASNFQWMCSKIPKIYRKSRGRLLESFQTLVNTISF